MSTLSFFLKMTSHNIFHFNITSLTYQTRKEFREKTTNDCSDIRTNCASIMSDVNDDAKHIESVEKFLQVCVERILDKNQTTNEKLYTTASSINALTEFCVAESIYYRAKMNDIHT